MRLWVKFEARFLDRPLVHKAAGPGKAMTVATGRYLSSLPPLQWNTCLHKEVARSSPQNCCDTPVGWRPVCFTLARPRQCSKPGFHICADVFVESFASVRIVSYTELFWRCAMGWFLRFCSETCKGLWWIQSHRESQQHLFHATVLRSSFSARNMGEELAHNLRPPTVGGHRFWAKSLPNFRA